MVKTKDGDPIKSNLIVSEVQKRPCLFDTNHPNYGDRAEKARCWDEVYENVVPGWSVLVPTEKFAAGKEVQKRWRSIRDSYTKAYRQGKCALPERCPPGSRRHQYHTQMLFLLRALQNKKPRYSQDKYESFSEVSNSPQHPPPEDFMPKIKNEILEKPLDLKTRPEQPEKPETVDKANQATIDNQTKDKIELKNPSLEIKIDANSILPDDHFDDDRLFMNSLIPLFKKMDDDTRLFCRIEVLKIIRCALCGVMAKKEMDSSMDTAKSNDSTLSMTTRSADGSRPIRKRKIRSPSPAPNPPKRRGPGRPRKIRPPPSDSDEEQVAKKKSPKTKIPPVELPASQVSEMDESLSKATSVDQLSTPLFMKMYNLKRCEDTKGSAGSHHLQVAIKSEPLEHNDPHMT